MSLRNDNSLILCTPVNGDRPAPGSSALQEVDKRGSVLSWAGVPPTAPFATALQKASEAGIPDPLLMS